MIDPKARPRLYGYVVGILDHLKLPSIQTGGVADHVHILCALGRTASQAELVKEVKKSSSKWMKTDGGVPRFSWQAGYGADMFGIKSRLGVVTYRVSPFGPFPQFGLIYQGVALVYRVGAPLARRSMQFATFYSIENACEREQPRWLILEFNALRITPHRLESHPALSAANCRFFMLAPR